MSDIFDNGYKAGEASYGKEKMSDFEGSQFKDEYMVGYCLARAEYEGGGTPFVFLSLGQHAGFYGLPKQAFKRYYKSDDYQGHFESGYEDGAEERRSQYSDDEDD